jgi:hypothetical protein
VTWVKMNGSVSVPRIQAPVVHHREALRHCPRQLAARLSSPTRGVIAGAGWWLSMGLESVRSAPVGRTPLSAQDQTSR